MRKYDLVVFDLDGTILNTLEDLCDSVNAILHRHQYPLRTITEVQNFVGNGIRLLIERAAPEGLPDKTVDMLHREFASYYQEHCRDKTRPYEGILEVIRCLRNRGYLTAVVSNKADSAVQTLCNQYFSGLLDAAVGERTDIARKPAPDSVNQVLKSLGILPDRAVYVGDSDVDIATAHNAGIDEIAVTWGFRDAVFLKQSGAEHLAGSPHELLDLV